MVSLIDLSAFHQLAKTFPLVLLGFSVLAEAVIAAILASVRQS